MNTLPVLLKFKQDYEPPEDLVKMQILIQQVCISNKLGDADTASPRTTD